MHHEIYLPAYPLCFEWLNFSSTDEKVNFLAIGDMQKDINIWDLDTVDVLDPVCALSGHKDSVLDLSWNTLTRKVMASGSADKTTRLWDLETKKVCSCLSWTLTFSAVLIEFYFFRRFKSLTFTNATFKVWPSILWSRIFFSLVIAKAELPSLTAKVAQ